jgi:hypothetical protein
MFGNFEDWKEAIVVRVYALRGTVVCNEGGRPWGKTFSAMWAMMKSLDFV